METLSFGEKIHHYFRPEGLEILLEQREVQPQFQKWLTKVLGYDFEILYQLGLQNKAADALSRMEPLVELIKEVEKDDELQKIITELERDTGKHAKYQWSRGRLLYKGRVLLLKTSSLIPTLLHTFHDSTLGGHSGFLRTYKRMSGELY